MIVTTSATRFVTLVDGMDIAFEQAMDEQPLLSRALTHRTAPRGRGQPVNRAAFVDTSPSVFDPSPATSTIPVRRWIGATTLVALALGGSVAGWLAASYFVQR